MIYWNQNDVDFVGVKRERDGKEREGEREREIFSKYRWG